MCCHRSKPCQTSVKNGNICCHQCHLKYVQNFWENGKSKLPANFTCKHKVTSIGLKYDDRHAEIPKYRVPYSTKFKIKIVRNDQSINLTFICIADNCYGFIGHPIFWSFSMSIIIF